MLNRNISINYINRYKTLFFLHFVKVHTLTSKGMNVMGNLKQYMINTQHKSCPLFSKTTIRYNLDTIFAEVEVKCGQPIISNLLD